MKRSLLIKLTIIAILVVPTFSVVHFFVPRHAVVTITGTEVRREDKDVPAGKPKETRDVYYINGDDLEKTKVRVFQNEDNGWYLKWNSADVQAQAMSLSQNKGSAVVSYYGWRNNWFSWFPNVLSLTPVEPTYRPLRLFERMVYGLYFLTLAALVGGWEWRQYRKRKAAREAALARENQALNGEVQSSDAQTNDFLNR